MLATIAAFCVISFIASILVIAATMLSSRLSHKEEYYLAEEFRSGGEVPGFRHVATIPLPEILNRPPVQIYRVIQ